jgi:hypothetical protein
MRIDEITEFVEKRNTKSRYFIVSYEDERPPRLMIGSATDNSIRIMIRPSMFSQDGVLLRSMMNGWRKFTQESVK